MNFTRNSWKGSSRIIPEDVDHCQLWKNELVNSGGGGVGVGFRIERLVEGTKQTYKTNILLELLL